MPEPISKQSKGIPRASSTWAAVMPEEPAPMMQARPACEESMTTEPIGGSRGLPEAHVVALDVLEVRREAHLAHGLLADQRLAAERLDLRQRGVDVIDVDDHDRPFVGTLAAEHAAVDEARLARSLLAARTRRHEGVGHVR